MSIQDTRLEIIKLVHRFDQSAEVLIERAKVLEAYINSVEAPQTKPTLSKETATKGTSKKDKDENSILS